MPFFVIPAEIDFNGSKSVLHARDVRPESHHPAVIGGNHFVDTVAKQKTPVHRRNSSLLEWHIIAVQICNGHVYLYVSIAT